MKKLLISFLLGLTVFLSFAPYLSPTKAQTTWYNQSPSEWYLKVYDSSNPNEIFGERYTAAQVQWIVYTIPSIFINWITNGNTDLGGCLMGVVGATLDAGLCVRGMNTAVANLVTNFGINPTGNISQSASVASQIFADRPISGIGYVRHLISKFSLVTTVHAQTTGFGFDILSSISSLWTVTRNAAFFLFIIVTVVFAFMIMFRIKLSPQVIISVQSALPKIIVALILVTFSFAIAGLMVDLMYIIMGVISTLLTPLLGDSPGFIFSFMNGTLPLLKDSGIMLIIYFIIYIITYLIAVIVALVAAVSGLQASSVIFTLLLLIFSVILLLILVWYVIKTIYVLFKNLAQVYGLIIIAPLQITGGILFPQMGFGTWFKKLFSKLMVFPLTGMFIYVSFVLLIKSMWFSLIGLIHNNIFVNVWNDLLVNGIFKLVGFNVPNWQATSMWGAPMLGNPAAATGIAFLLMSLGLIMMIPKISDAIDGFLASKGFAGSAIGEAMGPFGGLGKAAGGAAMGAGAGYLGGKLGEVTLTPEQKRKWYGKLFEGIREPIKDSMGKMGGTH